MLFRSTVRSGGWRDTIKNVIKDENDNNIAQGVPPTPPKQSYLSHKRNSISDFVGKVIRKLSISNKGEDVQENDFKSHFGQTLTNPLDFILMKEEYLKKNPPVKVEAPASSDTNGESMASVMDSLKKMVKKINPKREFADENNDKNGDRVLRSLKRQSDLKMSQYEERMKKYQVMLALHNVCYSKFQYF